MKSRYILLLALFISVTIRAQHERTFSTPITATSHATACDAIYLRPGFSFKPTNNAVFTASIQVNNCFNPVKYIDAGIYSSSFTYSDIQNTNSFSNQFGGSGNDIYYKLSLSRTMEVTVSHAGSALTSTYVHLLDANGVTITSNNSCSQYVQCSDGITRGYMKRELAPGIYYILSESRSAANGNIKTTIQGVHKIPSSFTDLGIKEGFFTYSNNGYISSYGNNFGRPTSSVKSLEDVYRFTITKPMEVVVSNCEYTTMKDTYLYLLNSNGDVIAENDNYAGAGACNFSSQAYIRKYLDPGTYYVIVDLYDQTNTYVSTQIEAYPIAAVDYIQVGIKSRSFTYSDTRNTNDFTYVYGPQKEVIYGFSLELPMTITISHCGSNLQATRAMLLNEDGEVITYDGTYIESECNNLTQAFIKHELEPGSYYVVSEGISEDGIITTKIEGSRSTFIDLGSKSTDFTYTDTQTPVNFIDKYKIEHVTRSLSDIFYRFTITKPMEITATNCGSEDGGTYLFLLDNQQNKIAESSISTSEQCSSTSQATLIKNLFPGTYYIVAEGIDRYMLKGITTTISGKECISTIDIGTYANNFTFFNTYDTNDFNNFYGSMQNDILHSFTLSKDMDVSLAHWEDSSPERTYLYLFNSDFECIESTDQLVYHEGYNNYGTCINMNLSAGTYFVISEGYSANSKISLTIKGEIPYRARKASPSSTRNYKITIIPTIETSEVVDLTTKQSIQTVDYYDGLGRPIQTIQVAATPSGYDIGNYKEYDDYGRVLKEWLPYKNNASRTGAFMSKNFFGSTMGGYYTEGSPYVEWEYEMFPFNRVVQQMNPGNTFHDRPIIANYLGNDANEVTNFIIENNNIKKAGFYAPNGLYKTQITDENGNIIYEYKDKSDQLILSRQINGSENYDTYYVYDIFGRLTCVIPPAATDIIIQSSTTIYNENNDLLKKYAYLYGYDERGRIIKKRIPGCDWVYMVYDKSDRMVMSQDGNQRTDNKWIVYKYDHLGRLLYEAEITLSASNTLEHEVEYFKDYVVKESFLDADAERYPMENTGYSRGWFHSVPTKLLKVNYYDDYRFRDLLKDYEVNWLDQSESENNGKGLVTGTRIYLLDGSGKYTVTANYYDNRGRLLDSYSTNYLGGGYYDNGFDMQRNTYNFRGDVTSQEILQYTYFSCESQTQGINYCRDINYNHSAHEIYQYEYDYMGRLTNTYYKIHSGESSKVLLSSQYYDDLGRLVKKERHGNLENTQYSYNIRNWITAIRDGDFMQSLHYDSPVNNSQPLYNGNISASTWTHGDVTNNTYLYYYDDLNRLSESIHTAHWGGNNETFRYDKHGNITSLTRKYQGETFDQLLLAYNGNQLKKVTDSNYDTGLYGFKEYCDLANKSQEFKYDANGNMIMDLDRNITSIKYNLLNLPEVVQFGNGSQIKNQYDASGVKLRTDYITTNSPLLNPLQPGQILTYEPNDDDIMYSSTLYAGNKEYQSFDDDPTAFYRKRVHNTEGFVIDMEIDQNTQKLRDKSYFHYYSRDHLGNITRVWQPDYKDSYGATRSYGTIQRTQYYPSGLPWYEGEGASYQPYKYNGKEFIEMHGYDMYDYHARGYYPSISRFTTIDPLAEDYYSWSPYVYCLNNPIKFVDPDGMANYGINPKGYVSMMPDVNNMYATMNYDILYAVDMAGNINKSVTGLRVKDQDILSQLSTERNNFDGRYAMTESNEVGNVFLFAAKNSDVEWGLQGISTKGNNKYIIATSHDPAHVQIDGARNTFGFTENALTFEIHSHPSPTGTKGASGDMRQINGLYTGDMQRITRRYYRFRNEGIDLPNHYVYHKYSNNLYHYTPFESNIFIRQIRSPQGLNFLFPKK